jgi:hypothetical protein
LTLSNTLSSYCRFKFELAVTSQIDLEIDILDVVFTMSASLQTADPDCSGHVKKDLEMRIESFPPSFLPVLVSGEVFKNGSFCKECL